MFPEITHKYYCWICSNAVDLETCKTDEYGIAVHENCYVAKLALASEAIRLTKKPPVSSSYRPAVLPSQAALSSQGALPSQETRVAMLMNVAFATAAIAVIAAVVSLVPLLRARSRLQRDIANLQSQLPMPANTARKVHPIESSDIEFSSDAGRRAELLPAMYNFQQGDVAWRVGGTFPKQGFDSSSLAIFILENSALVPKGSLTQMKDGVEGEQRLLRTLLKTENTPNVGDVVFYATGLSMFYYKDHLGRPFVVGMTPCGILSLDPDFAPIIGYGAVPYPNL